MKETKVTIPEIGLIAGTRAALGAGIALLLADRLSDPQRKAIGWTLFAVGAITTIPLALDVFGHRQCSANAGPAEHWPRTTETEDERELAHA
jgi:hypothetical protein